MTEDPTHRNWLKTEDGEAFVAEMSVSTPRAQAVLGHSLVETSIDLVLSARLHDDLGSHKVEDMGYVRKCALLYQLGLINRKTVSQLQVIGHVRNRFAHGTTLSTLNDPKIASELKGLPNRYFGDSDLPPVFVPLAMLVRRAPCWGQVIWIERLPGRLDFTQPGYDEVALEAWEPKALGGRNYGHSTKWESRNLDDPAR